MSYNKYHISSSAILTESEEWRTRQLYDNHNKSSGTTEEVPNSGNYDATEDERTENVYTNYEGMALDDTIQNQDLSSDVGLQRDEAPYTVSSPPTDDSLQEPVIDYTSELHKILLLPDGPQRRKKLLHLFDKFYSAAEEGLTAIAAGMLKRGNFGGQAGGVKFTWKGVFFKRAEDNEIRRGFYLYGGRFGPSNYFAGKAASNELKASNTLFREFYTRGIQIILPLQILFDFHGERVLAMSLLPLKGAKLVYGSNDSGRTVHNDDPNLDKMISSVADELHLAAHIVRDEKSSKILHLAGDVEGHAVDGKFFLLDLARMWPPEAPSRGPASSIFFRLMRPEFLQHLRKKGFPALSPDALARWGGDEDNAIHNRNVRDATALLFQERIPEWVKQTETSIVEDTVRWERLIWPTCSTELQAELRRWLEPIQNKVLSPADLLQAMNFLVLRWLYKEKRQLSTAEWDPAGLLSNSEWVKKYGQALSSLQSRLSSTLHSFGIPVRHLCKVLECTTLPELRDMIQVDLIARAAKSRVRFLLRADSADGGTAVTLADRIVNGLLTEEDCAILEAIAVDKFNVKFSNFSEMVKKHGPAIAGYLYKTCGLRVPGKTLTDQDSICVPRPKLNSFLSFVRANVHLDEAFSVVWESEDSNGSRKVPFPKVVEELNAAKALAEEVVQSDPNDQQAEDLAILCSRLLDLAQLRSITVRESGQAAQSQAGVLRWWLERLTDRQVREIGVHMIGDRRIAFYMAAWLGFDDTEGGQHLHYWKGEIDKPRTLLIFLTPWPQNIYFAFLLSIDDCASGKLAIHSYVSAFKMGTKAAAFEMAVAAQLHLPLVYNAYTRAGMSVTHLNNAVPSPVGQGGKKKNEDVVEGALVVRNPSGWMSQDTDGGPGSIGQIVSADFSDEALKCYVEWMPVIPTRKLLQIIGEDRKFELLPIDDQYLAFVASNNGPAALADLEERMAAKQFPLNNGDDKVWLATLDEGRQSGREVRVEEVEDAQTGAWELLAARGRDPLIMDLLAANHSDQALEGPLVVAARTAYLPAVKRLLECGATVQTFDREKRSTLHHAASHGWLDIVQILLERGCPPAHTDCNGKYALHMACENNQSLVAEVLLARTGPNVTCNFQRTPLHDAAGKGAAACIRVLIKHQANLDAPDKQNATALHIAAEMGHVEVMQELLEAKASITATMTTGETALHRAARACIVDSCEVLLRAKADVNAQTGFGDKPHTIYNTRVGHMPKSTMLAALKRVGPEVVGKENYDVIVNGAQPSPLPQAPKSKEKKCVLQ